MVIVIDVFVINYKFLAVPVNSAPVERVFSLARKILHADRCELLPKNFVF